jgi:hypothetical protein
LKTRVSVGSEGSSGSHRMLTRVEISYGISRIWGTMSNY